MVTPPCGYASQLTPFPTRHKNPVNAIFFLCPKILINEIIEIVNLQAAGKTFKSIYIFQM